jgi:hypothetical protein
MVAIPNVSVVNAQEQPNLRHRSVTGSCSAFVKLGHCEQALPSPANSYYA